MKNSIMNSRIERAVRKVRNGTTLARLESRKALAGGQVCINYGWMKLLYTGDGDRQELAYHQNQRAWRAHEMAVFSRHVARGAVVADVGANLGFISAMLASLVGPDGLVLAFEPSPVTYSKLLKTIELNGLLQVRPCNVGLGATAGMMELVAVSRSSGNNTLVPTGDINGAARQTVSIITLDEVPELETRRLEFLKIDTEGYEAAVLNGARGVLKRDRPVIYTELGGGGGFRDSTTEAVGLLGDLGYDVSRAASTDWATVGNGVDFLFEPYRR